MGKGTNIEAGAWGFLGCLPSRSPTGRLPIFTPEEMLTENQDRAKCHITVFVKMGDEKYGIFEIFGTTWKCD